MPKSNNGTVATEEEVQSFFDGYEEATIGSRIPDGTYHLRCVGNLGEPDWSAEDKPVVEVEIEVASGEQAEGMAPRLRLQLGGFEFINKKTGKKRVVSAQSVFSTLQGTIRAIHGTEPPSVNPAMVGIDLLTGLADAIIGDDFVASVVTNKGTGFQDLRNIHGMDDLPEGFTLAADLAEFSV